MGQMGKTIFSPRHVGGGEYLGSTPVRKTKTGFLQFKIGGPGQSAWLFEVSSFDEAWGGHPAMATLVTVDGAAEVPMDERGRIFVEGRWCGPRHYNA
jgi:hypothetical protein